MSELGDDIKETHEAVGDAVTILRDAGNLAGEYCILKQNRQVTKPFVREFFQEGKFDWDTDAVSGDVIQLDDGRRFIVMNKTPVRFANETIEHAAVLYKCNVSGEVLRISGEATYDANYQLRAAFMSQRTTAHGLLTEALYGHDLETDEELALLGLENHELYIPRQYGIHAMDRYIPASGEILMVEAVRHRKYDNVDVATLVVDLR